MDCRQTRPDPLAATSLLAQALSRPRVAHVVAAKALVKNAMQDADFRLVFKHDADGDYGNCCVLCSSNAAFADAASHGDKFSHRLATCWASGLRAGTRCILGVRYGPGEARVPLYVCCGG